MNRIAESTQLKQLTSRLVDIGIALSSMTNLDDLLELIVTEARSFTNSDAGSLYIIDRQGLRFSVAQNDTLARRLGGGGAQQQFKPFTMPLTNQSVAGYVAITGEEVNIRDVYKIPDTVPYKFNRSFDDTNGYRTRSMLAVPMRDRMGHIIGVLQLINCMDRAGNVKPFSKNYGMLIKSLASQAAVAIQNARLTRELKDAHYDTIFRLSVAAEYRDKDTSSHLKRMSNYSKIIAKYLGWTDHQQEVLLYSSPMHDVGKIGIPDAILLKPGRLTDEEREIMKTHPKIGAEILTGSDSEVLRMSEVIALCHHEKMDGTGYPRGMKGDEIPLEGRIVALADVFDALASARCYKAAVPWEGVLDIIRKDTGTHFDPLVADAFMKGIHEVRKVYEQYQD